MLTRLRPASAHLASDSQSPRLMMLFRLALRLWLAWRMTVVVCGFEASFTPAPAANLFRSRTVAARAIRAARNHDPASSESGTALVSAS